MMMMAIITHISQIWKIRLRDTTSYRIVEKLRSLTETRKKGRKEVRKEKRERILK
jgi:hypothetical protein